MQGRAHGIRVVARLVFGGAICLVMVGETCGSGVTCERSAERRRHSGSTCLGIRREDDTLMMRMMRMMMKIIMLG